MDREENGQGEIEKHDTVCPYLLSFQTHTHNLNPLEHILRNVLQLLWFPAQYRGHMTIT